jgi:hypothetical protein
MTRYGWRETTRKKVSIVGISVLSIKRISLEK